MSEIRLIDTTLRDGSHAVHHQYTTEQIANICEGLEKSGIYAAEVGHGAGIGGSILNYGFAKHTDKEILTAAKSKLKKTKLGTLLVPGLGTMDDLRIGADLGLDMVRVAVHCTEVDVGEQHIKLSKSLGLETIAFFMMSHMIGAKELAEYAKMAESYGADVIYFADSSGYMSPVDIRDRVNAIKSLVKVPIGVHTHNNLGLGVGNAIAGVEAGATYLDGTLEGLGAGSGNGNMQAIVAVLNRMGIKTNADVYELMELGKNYVRPIIKHSLEITNESILLGYIGIYSSFYLDVMEASKKFNIAPKLIFEELGRRKVVGGQEDQILDICYKILENRL